MNSTTQGTREQDARGKLYVYVVSFVAAIGGFLFGYDLVIVTGAMIFLKDAFHLNSAQVGFATSCAVIGCMVGPFAGGWLCDKVGRKRTLMFCGVLFAISAIGTALPQTMLQFYIFRIIGGMGIGLASVASPMYIAEISPPRVRGRMVLMFQLAVVVGCLGSVIVAYFLSFSESWQWMFASALVPTAVLIIFLTLVPESPRWLAQMKRLPEALAVLTRINGRERAEVELKEIEASIAEETGAFSELFQPGIRKALLIGLTLGILSNITGWSAIGYYLPIIFQKAGFTKASDAIGQSLIVFSFSLLFTVFAVWLVDRMGRRPLWLIGSAVLAIGLTVTALVFKMSGLWIVLPILLCSFGHHVGPGPLSWLMISELFPTRIRARAVITCTIVIWIAGWSAAQFFPMICGAFEQRFGTPAGAFWIFVAFSVFSFVFGWRWLPETKGRSLEEIATSLKAPLAAERVTPIRRGG